MHICGMDFSSLASYWQIKALLMLEPSVVTPQNQYFPANSERMSVHCLESGCIGKYTHLGPRGVYFPIHPSSRQCTDTIFYSCNMEEKVSTILQYWSQILNNICWNVILMVLIACNCFCHLFHQSCSTFCILCFAGIQYKWFQYFAVGNTPNTGSTLSLPWILQQQILASHRSCQYFWIFLNIVASSANTGITSALATIWHHVATLELTIWRFHFDICANPILSKHEMIFERTSDAKYSTKLLQ